MSSDIGENPSHIVKGDVDEINHENGLNDNINYNLSSEINTIESSDSSPSKGPDYPLNSNDTPNFNGTVNNIKIDADSKENKSVSDNNSDSGVDLIDTILQTSDSEISPSKTSSVIVTNNFNEESIPASPTTDCFDAGSKPEVPSLGETLVPKQTKEHVTNDYKNIARNNSCDNLQSINNGLISNINLNNQVTLDKAALSKSADSLTAKQNDIQKETNLDADEILTEFTSQKNKASAVQKIPESPHTLDVRYPRIPKEILSQDIGSIVKNVHGIFSSVSGSLKNAYTHRTTTQKPIKTVKPITNGKIMSDIFEDENIETDKCVEIENPNVEQKELEENVEIGEGKKDMRLQIEMLEKLLAEQKKENGVLRERVREQVEEAQHKDQMFKEVEVKLDMMGKRLEQAEREKDAAVMRYASIECTKIEAKRAAENAARNEKAALAEVELLNNKLKSAHAEKQRICQLYDDKCHDLVKCEREVSKVKEDLRELEGRLKWTQSKLRMEIDAYKDSTEKVEKLSQQVTELEAAKEAAANNATDAAKIKQLENDLKETQAALILTRHDKDELEKKLNCLSIQHEISSRERDAATCCLAKLTAEVEKLKESNLRLEEEAAELAALRAQAALADTLSAQLQRESERAALAEAAVSEQRALAETCLRREAAALEQTARLTAHHVAHRAAAEKHHATAEALAVDNASLREKITKLEDECANLQKSLTEETDRRNKENRVLARKVAELTEEVSEVNKKLEWEKGENGVLKKKHSSAIKELNRELQRAMKRCTQLEAKLQTPDATSTRTGSISSLSSSESAAHEERIQNGAADSIPDIQVREPDRQALIERIVSLQRAAARRTERCEFLEEHVKQLTGELRSKSKLLRSLLCELPAGAVGSQDRDVNKSEIARLGGGAMAAVWGGDRAGITLDLSIEMNKRLQAVLEDTLLKNITLKENMDTLGAEISRLKEQSKTKDETKLTH